MGFLTEVCTHFADQKMGFLKDICTHLADQKMGFLKEVCTHLADQKMGFLKEVCTHLADQKMGFLKEVCTHLADQKMGFLKEVCTHLADQKMGFQLLTGAVLPDSSPPPPPPPPTPDFATSFHSSEQLRQTKQGLLSGCWLCFVRNSNCLLPFLSLSLSLFFFFFFFSADLCVSLVDTRAKEMLETSAPLWSGARLHARPDGAVAAMVVGLLVGWRRH